MVEFSLDPDTAIWRDESSISSLTFGGAASVTLNDLLKLQGIDPASVLVMRHSPSEPSLKRKLPWFAAEKPETFNAYQQTQGERVEKAMLGAKYVASFLAHGGSRGLFVGLYKIGKTKILTHAAYWRIPAYVEMRAYGMIGFNAESRPTCLWFDLALQKVYRHWQGRLVVDWPPPGRAWWRWADRNEIKVHAVLEENALAEAMPDWKDLVLSWDDLAVMPKSWRVSLAHMRGIYLIFDKELSKGYVGSAYGADNLFGRWTSYSRSGHGGNRLLRQRDPKNFSFSILQRVSPDMDTKEIVELEATWKRRLHTRDPWGLNDN